MLHHNLRLSNHTSELLDGMNQQLGTPSRVSIWEVEPVVTPFYICPPPFFRPKFPRQAGNTRYSITFSSVFISLVGADEESDTENAFKRGMPWLGDDFGIKDASSSIFPGLSLVQWMNMQQNNQFSGFMPPHNTDDPSNLLTFQNPSAASSPNLHLNKQNHQLMQPHLPWPHLQQQQQLLPIPMNQQQLHSQQQLQHQQQQPQPSPSPPPQQQIQQQQQRLFQNNSAVSSNQIPSQSLQQAAVYPQLLTGSSQSQPIVPVTIKNSFQLPPLPQDSHPQFQQQMEHQPGILQRHQQQAALQQSPLHLLQNNLSQRVQQQVQQLSQQGLSDQQIQLQLLQKLQQQQQLISQTSSILQPQLLHQQQAQQNQQFQQLPSAQHQQQHIGSNNLPTSMFVQSQQLPVSQPQSQNKPLTTVKARSGVTEGDAPSCSTSPSTVTCQVLPSSFINRSQQVSTIMGGDSMGEPASNLMQELQSKADIQIKHEFPSTKGPDQLKYKGTIIDQLEASSSATSYCLDAGTIQQSYSLPTFCMDSDVQSTTRNNIPLAANVDGLAPDTLLSRGFDSQKDLQNLLANYGATPRDIETELSTAGISSQSFGIPNMPFKPGCSADVAINDTGVLNGGVWVSQTQRMRTYTKVQKRGSVGRSIDVTRYTGYDELRRDLAHMFGIEGQLEDVHRTEWKLVYVDHENDILLVGDDPWEEFVNCVQSIKILSSVEVQQMSLDGDLGHEVTNKACSGTGTESGNGNGNVSLCAGHYDDNSAASFNR